MRIETPIRAIRLHCLDCCAWQREEVRECCSVDCSLWAYRFGKRPSADMIAVVEATKDRFEEQKRKHGIKTSQNGHFCLKPRGYLGGFGTLGYEAIKVPLKRYKSESPSLREQIKGKAEPFFGIDGVGNGEGGILKGTVQAVPSSSE